MTSSHANVTRIAAGRAGDPAPAIHRTTGRTTVAMTQARSTGMMTGWAT